MNDLSLPEWLLVIDVVAVLCRNASSSSM